MTEIGEAFSFIRELQHPCKINNEQIHRKMNGGRMLLRLWKRGIVMETFPLTTISSEKTFVQGLLGILKHPLQNS